MTVRAVGRTDVGLARKENQDNFLILPALSVYAVADGMGGHAGGGQASAIAVEALRRALHGGGASGAVDRGAAYAVDEAGVEDALALANAMIMAEADKMKWAGMGTTLVLAYPAGDRWMVAHIGDSRAYVVSRDRIYALTKDHSLVEELLSRGSITQEEAKVHPHRHVLTRALGTEADKKPTWSSVAAAEAPYLLLCTDGLYNMLEEETMQRIVVAPDLTLEEKADRLVEEANAMGGLDNITVILIAEEDGV